MRHLLPLSMVAKSVRHAQRDGKLKSERAALKEMVRTLVAYEASEKQREGGVELRAEAPWMDPHHTDWRVDHLIDTETERGVTIIDLFPE